MTFEQLLLGDREADEVFGGCSIRCDFQMRFGENSVPICRIWVLPWWRNSTSYRQRNIVQLPNLIWRLVHCVHLRLQVPMAFWRSWGSSSVKSHIFFFQRMWGFRFSTSLEVGCTRAAKCTSSGLSWSLCCLQIIPYTTDISKYPSL